MAERTSKVRTALVTLGITGMVVSVVLTLDDVDGMLLRRAPVKELVLAVVSVGVLAVGMMVPRPKPKEEAPTPPQLAGETCAGCGQKIVMESEGARCAICKQAVHEECRTDHERLGHREDGMSAYR